MINELFLEKEADLGSENEDHDDNIKDARKEEIEEYREDLKYGQQEELGENVFLEELVDLEYENNLTAEGKYKDEKKILKEEFDDVSKKYFLFFNFFILSYLIFFSFFFFH